MKILQRNLNRSAFVVWEMKRNVSIVRFKFRCNILIRGKIIKEMPGSVASGTSCTILFPYYTHRNPAADRATRALTLPDFQKNYYNSKKLGGLPWKCSKYTTLNCIQHFILPLPHFSKKSGSSSPIPPFQKNVLTYVVSYTSELNL